MKTLSIVFSSSLILVVVILLFIAVSSPVISPTTSTDQSTVTINQTVFRVDIVDKIQEHLLEL